MSDENSVVPRAAALAGARKEWQRPLLRVLGAKFARNTNHICADNNVPSRDNGSQCS